MSMFFINRPRKKSFFSPRFFIALFGCFSVPATNILQKHMQPWYFVLASDEPTNHIKVRLLRRPKRNRIKKKATFRRIKSCRRDSFLRAPSHKPGWSQPVGVFSSGFSPEGLSRVPPSPEESAAAALRGFRGA
jgi:hypothetical protein